ncbi:Anthranilate phosphoribosyltransferase [Candida viswanathii]|uniref:Anthranilate phosphoribosyltransferase n=1 Tax=Candida viswanathii TaxID=5486 RepID=A0A367YEJ5_9ASCO|nr:Anthranilate phosphoribosyltransferase [Candida viswanathii]
MTTTKNVLTPFLKKLVHAPPTLTPEELAQALRLIFQDAANDIQTGAFLTALSLRGLDKQAEYIAAAGTTVLEFAKTIPKDSVDATGYIDIVGTGGDGQNTFNVSTSSAIVAAGMGLPVCKHGGKASTSTSGSADLLASLGVDLLKVDETTTPAIVAKSKFCFLFAPSFHPGMGLVAHIRSQLGVPTIFNVLGPLINPMPLRARVLGVNSRELGESYAVAASKLSKGRTLVVFGDVKLDEVSPCGMTSTWLVDEEGNIERGKIQPSDFGLLEHSLADVASGTPAENAEKLMLILRGEETHKAIKDYILLNSACLAVVAGLAGSWKEGVELARKSIDSGAALKALEVFIDACKA